MLSTSDFFDLVEFFSTNTEPLITYRQSNPSFPPMDIIQQKDNKYVELRFAVAGFSKDEISIESEDEFLVVSAEKKKEEKKEEPDYYWIKRTLRADGFTRKFVFPNIYFDFRNPEVTLENGILSIKIYKNKDLVSEKKKIEVK